MRITFSLLVVMLLGTISLAAGDHIVASSELHQQLVGAAQTRQANISKIERFLTHDVVQKAVRTAGMDTAKVTQAVSLLGDEELARLAARASKAESDFAAGALTNQQITYILIALATAVIVLLIVEH
jgi:hypothetical protein